MQNRYFAALAKIVVTLLILAILLRQTSAGEVFAKMSKVDGWVIVLCTLLTAASSVPSALRWKIVLQHLGAARSLPRLLRFTMIGSLFNQLLPTGMGGDFLRAWYVVSSGVPLGVAISSVAVDRLVGVLALLVLVGVGIPLIAQVAGIGTLFTALVSLAAISATAIMLFLRLDLSGAELHKRWTGRGSSTGKSVTAFLIGMEQSAVAARSVLGTWPDGAIALALSILNHVVHCVILFVLARALNSDVGLIAAVALGSCVLLIATIPISFAAWGLREGAMVVVFASAGMPKETALSASILFGTCLLVSGILGGLPWIFERSVSGLNNDGSLDK